MRSRYVKGWFGASVVALGAFATSADAQQIPLTEASVIGGSGAWQANPYDTGQFNAANVADFQTGTAIDESEQNENDSNGGFWLGKEGDLAEDFVLDLGQAYQIGNIDLFNTHNANFNDRATGGFEIYGSNEVSTRSTGETGSGGGDLVNAVLLTSGTLVLQPNAEGDELTAQTVTVNDTNSYRYIRFNTLSGAGVGNVGLNEIRVFQVPEPAGVALLGISAGVLVLRRRRRTGG